jgi:hypothetical protein
MMRRSSSEFQVMIMRKFTKGFLINGSRVPLSGSWITRISKRGSLRGTSPVCGARERVSLLPVYTEHDADLQRFVSWLGQNNDCVSSLDFLFLDDDLTIDRTAVVEAAKYRYPELRAPIVFFYCENEHYGSLQASYILSSFIKQLC